MLTNSASQMTTQVQWVPPIPVKISAGTTLNASDMAGTLAATIASYFGVCYFLVNHICFRRNWQEAVYLSWSCLLNAGPLLPC